MNQTATGNKAQRPQATRGCTCSQAGFAPCRRALWCHDKSLQQKVWSHFQSRLPGGHGHADSELSPPVPARAATEGLATLFCATAETALPPRNRVFDEACRRTRSAIREARRRVRYARARLFLLRLESLQAPWRARCWLIRSCLIPLLRLLKKNNTDEARRLCAEITWALVDARRQGVHRVLEVLDHYGLEPTEELLASILAEPDLSVLRPGSPASDCESTPGHHA